MFRGKLYLGAVRRSTTPIWRKTDATATLEALQAPLALVTGEWSVDIRRNAH
jgi:hypothetical protein